MHVTQRNLHPIALAFFGGVLGFNKMGFLKLQLEKDGFKELEPGRYDLRVWD